MLRRFNAGFGRLKDGCVGVAVCEIGEFVCDALVALRYTGDDLLDALVKNLPAGAFVELAINWPVLLQNIRPLTLLIVGRVVRCEDRKVAIKTNRYEFVTRPPRPSVIIPPGKPNPYLT
jgi:hypothetical protein